MFFCFLQVVLECSAQIARCRRLNHFRQVPVPRVGSLEELNQVLVAACRADEQRRITGKPHTVGEALRIEREHLLPLPAEEFELAETSRCPRKHGKFTDKTKRAAHWAALSYRKLGSSGRTRTYNPPVNSRMLCH